MTKIHLKPPSGCFSACGLGDPTLSQNTSDIFEVNCGKCLRTVAARKLKPGPKPHGDRPKVKISFSIEADLLDLLNQEKNRSAVVNEALKLLYSNHSK